jgi:predicted ATPase
MGLWLAGWSDQSRRQQHNLLARGEQLRDIFSIIYANTTAAFVAVLRGDLDEARQLLDQSIPLGEQYSSSMFSALGMVVQGCLAVRGEDFATDITTLKKALSNYHATSAQSLLPVFLSFLAEGLSRCGKSEEAFATLAEALRLSETSLDVYWEAELYRLKGELLLAQEGKNQKVKVKGQKSKKTDPRPPTPDPQGEAEACFLKAIEIARRQEAKSLELRAVMSLVRLRQQQTTRQASRPTSRTTRTLLDQARDMLSEVYHWFTEGFDTKDLQEAKALLIQLASPSIDVAKAM